VPQRFAGITLRTLANSVPLDFQSANSETSAVTATGFYLLAVVGELQPFQMAKSGCGAGIGLLFGSHLFGMLRARPEHTRESSFITFKV
jgi:hypothetical protein